MYIFDFWFLTFKDITKSLVIQFLLVVMRQTEIRFKEGRQVTKKKYRSKKKMEKAKQNKTNSKCLTFKNL